MRHTAILFVVALLFASFTSAAPEPPALDSDLAPLSVAEEVQEFIASLQPAATPGQCSAESTLSRSAGDRLVLANHCPYEGSFCYNGGFTCAAACSACNKAPGLCPFGFCICFDT